MKFIIAASRVCWQSPKTFLSRSSPRLAATSNFLVRSNFCSMSRSQFPPSSINTSSTTTMNVDSNPSGLRHVSSVPSINSMTGDKSNPSTNPPSPSSSSFQSPSPSSYTVLHPSHTNESGESSSESSELRWLFDNNKQWAKTVERQYPGFFNKLSKQQKPKYMWIGCSDSRVPASEITGLMPGEVFVHRNVANCVVHADLNLLACLQLAVDILKVEHIIVCGHYGCGGINFALQPTQVGVADNWIRHIKDVARANSSTLAKHSTFEEKSHCLSELNVISQVENVCHTSIVQNAWRRGQSLAVHGWVYGVHDGILRNLVEPSIKGFDQVSPAFHIDGPTQINEP